MNLVYGFKDGEFRPNPCAESLKHQNTDDLHCMYKILGRIPDGLPKMANYIISSYLCKMTVNEGG